jgi:O-antigen/teichoic acid export membrane protein
VHFAQSVKHRLASLIPAAGSARRQVVFVVLGDAITFIALFATAMVLARIIGKDDMATFRQVTYLVPLVASLVELGFGSTVYRFYRAYQGEQRQVFLWQVLCAMLALGMLGSLVLLALAYPLAAAYRNPALAPAMLLTCGQVLATLPFMMVRPILINQGFSLKATLWETGFGLGTSLALIIPLWRGATLNQGLVWWMAANAGRLLVVWWYVGRPLWKARLVWDRAVTREVWDYVWPLQVSRVPGVVMAYFDKVVTSVFLNKGAFAAYSLGARELPFLGSIPTSVSSVMLPRMVEALRQGDLARVCALWRKSCLSTALMTYPVAAFCIWYAKPIVRTLFTSAYDDSAIPFAAFAGITFLRVVDYGSMAKALNQNVITLRTAVVTMLISVPLSVGLTFAFGVWGISGSLLLSTLLMVVYYLVQYRGILRCPVDRFFPLAALVGVMALAWGAVWGADLVLHSVLAVRGENHTLRLILRLGGIFALSGGFYVAALLLVRLFNPAPFAGLRLPGLRGVK